MQKIVILTGAGVSAESGLSTFRAEGGLWAQHRIEDVATPEAFARDPQGVVDFYNTRRAQAAKAKPNDGHKALARLEAEYAGDVVLVTDDSSPCLWPLAVIDALHPGSDGTARVATLRLATGRYRYYRHRH